jgi:outer membrane receptor protein involved in Fe transport
LDIKSIRSQNNIKTDKLENQAESKRLDLRLQTDFILSKRLTFGIDPTKYLIENLGNKPQDYLFLDCSSTYRIKKNDFEISLYARNLTNEKYFQTINFADNSSAITDFNLRPRQILLKFGFKF